MIMKNFEVSNDVFDEIVFFDIKNNYVMGKMSKECDNIILECYCRKLNVSVFYRNNDWEEIKDSWIELLGMLKNNDFGDDDSDDISCLLDIVEGFRDFIEYWGRDSLESYNKRYDEILRELKVYEIISRDFIREWYSKGYENFEDFRNLLNWGK